MTNTPGYCRYCGGELSTSQDRFCPNCGRATSESGPSIPSPAAAGHTFAPYGQSIYESPKTRSKWTLVFFGVLIAVIAASLVSTAAEIRLLERVVDGESVAERELTASDDRRSAIAGITLIVYVCLIIAFCTWVYRASKNLGALNAAGQRFSPGWSVGWWFVPIMNLFRPYQVMREIWRGSDPRVTDQDPSAWQYVPPSPILGWWWGIWIVSNLIAIGVSRVLTSDDIPPEDLLTAHYFSLVWDGLTIVAAVMAFMLVRGITSNQDAKHLNLDSANRIPTPGGSH